MPHGGRSQGCRAPHALLGCEVRSPAPLELRSEGWALATLWRQCLSFVNANEAGELVVLITLPISTYAACVVVMCTQRKQNPAFPSNPRSGHRFRPTLQSERLGVNPSQYERLGVCTPPNLKGWAFAPLHRPNDPCEETLPFMLATLGSGGAAHASNSRQRPQRSVWIPAFRCVPSPRSLTC